MTLSFSSGAAAIFTGEHFLGVGFMGRPLCLQRLSKTGRLRIVKFKLTTPGSFTRLIAPSTETAGAKVIDASHPWADQHPRLYARKLPTFQNAFLNVRAYPKALLEHPDRPRPFLPAPETPYGKDGRIRDPGKTVNMSLMHIMMKKNVHKSAVVRNRIKTRIRSAIGLLVTKGAMVENVGEEERLVSSGVDGEKWVMQNWTYVFTPNLEVYRMPLTTLLKGVQEVLTAINAKCRALGNVWKLEASRHRRVNSNTPVRNSGSKRRNISEDREYGRPGPTLSRVSALLGPYVSPGAKADDDYLSDDLLLDDEDEIRHTQPLPARKSASPAPFAVRLPPRRASQLENDAATAGIPAATAEVPDVDGRPGVAAAMFSRKPILRPVVDTSRQGHKKR